MFAGVDTHKDTLAVAVIDHAGRVVSQLELPNQDSGYVRLLALLTSHNVVRVGIEGSGNFGWPAAIYLLKRDLNVVEVPPLMTSRERLGRPGQGKTGCASHFPDCGPFKVHSGKERNLCRGNTQRIRRSFVKRRRKWWLRGLELLRRWRGSWG